MNDTEKIIQDLREKVMEQEMEAIMQKLESLSLKINSPSWALEKLDMKVDGNLRKIKEELNRLRETDPEEPEKKTKKTYRSSETSETIRSQYREKMEAEKKTAKEILDNLQTI